VGASATVARACATVLKAVFDESAAYQSDYEQSLILGEKVAIGLLRDQKATFNESAGWRFARFDGTQITI
jgi:hypothetical protein